MIDTDLPGSFADVQGAATWLTSLADGMEGAGDKAARARSAAAADWDGDSHHAYATHAGDVITAGDARAAVVRRCADAVETYAWELQACQREMAAHRERATAGGLVVSGTVIEAPPAPFDPGPPLVMPTPAQQHRYDDATDAMNARIEQNELYEQLRLDVRATYDRLDSCVTSTLVPAQEEAASDSGLETLLDKAKAAADGAGHGITFGETAFTVRERDLRAAATAAATALAARRSRNPAVRSGSKAPTPRGLTNASKPGTRAAGLAADAAELARWGKVLKFGGPVIGIVGSGVALANGESPSSVAVGFGAGLAAGVVTGAVVAAGVVSTPVWATAAAVVLVGAGVSWAATKAWEAWVPEDVRDSIDDGARAAWDWTTNTVSEAWDDAGDAVSGAWNSVFG